MKFEIHTSIITKVINDKNEAMETAKKMSIKYGRASVRCGHTRIAMYVKGIAKQV